MQISKIYFDMDGVLADFDRGVLELCHMELCDQEDGDEERDKQLWAAVRDVGHFYDRLEPVPGAFELFNGLRKKYGDKVEILTAVPKPHRNIPTAGEDKINWARRLLSDDVKINIVLRAEKKNYCKDKSYILIDDFSWNIDEWETNGGTGVLFENAESVRGKIKEIEQM